MDRRLDRGVRRLSEPADRCVLHRQADLVEERHFLWYAAERPSAGDSIKRLLLTNGSHAAGDTLTARLVAEERRDAKEDLLHVHRVVERDDDARSQRR